VGVARGLPCHINILINSIPHEVGTSDEGGAAPDWPGDNAGTSARAILKDVDDAKVNIRLKRFSCEAGVPPEEAGDSPGVKPGVEPVSSAPPV
jgi:hypothetical protein